MANILIVDDDVAFLDSLSEALRDEGHQVQQAQSARQGLQLLDDTTSVAIVDLRIPGECGLEFLAQARLRLPSMPCIMLTAYASGSNTIEAMRLGAFDHLTKPIGREELMDVLGRALQRAHLLANDSAGEEVHNDDSSEIHLVGNSQAMRQVYKNIGQVADSDATVMVQGETGTGKELVARALHRNSSRAGKPFIAVNCAAIPAELLESELFGHVRGAFSGAVNDRPGRVREANGGTLFLDEIGVMSLYTQAKILRALQEREVSPVGSSRSVPIDVRIVTATHQDLPLLVGAGLFREDLWYRLQVISIDLPPLRKRRCDILPLAEYFIRQQAKGVTPQRLTAAAAKALMEHDWPGNVRELRNTLQRATVLSQCGVIDVDQLGLAIPVDVGEVFNIEWSASLAQATASLEREMIRRALLSSKNNRADAARKLGLSRQQLYRKLEHLGFK